MKWCTATRRHPIPVGEQVEDMGARILGTAPPAKGTRFAVSTSAGESSAYRAGGERVRYCRRCESVSRGFIELAC
jgi:hypothetical protein